MRVRLTPGSPFFMKKTIIIVTALIKKDDKYLLTKRYDPKRPIVHETWQLVGGGLRFGESILECLHREVREETGHQIEVISILPFIHEKFRMKPQSLHILIPSKDAQKYLNQN